MLHVLVYQVSPNTLLSEHEECNPTSGYECDVDESVTVCIISQPRNGHPSPFVRQNIKIGDLDILNDWQNAFGVITKIHQASA